MWTLKKTSSERPKWAVWQDSTRIQSKIIRQVYLYVQLCFWFIKAKKSDFSAILILFLTFLKYSTFVHSVLTQLTWESLSAFTGLTLARDSSMCQPRVRLHVLDNAGWSKFLIHGRILEIISLPLSVNKLRNDSVDICGVSFCTHWLSWRKVAPRSGLVDMETHSESTPCALKKEHKKSVKLAN
jgi:hypothetical protein